MSSFLEVLFPKKKPAGQEEKKGDRSNREREGSIYPSKKSLIEIKQRKKREQESKKMSNLFVFREECS